MCVMIRLVRKTLEVAAIGAIVLTTTATIGMAGTLDELLPAL